MTATVTREQVLETCLEMFVRDTDGPVEIKAKLLDSLAKGEGLGYWLSWNTEKAILADEKAKLAWSARRFLEKQIQCDEETEALSLDIIRERFAEARIETMRDLTRAPWRHSSTSEVASIEARMKADALVSMLENQDRVLMLLDRAIGK